MCAKGGSRDLVVDKALLLESGFEELGGVDFEKGCYVGQEVTARMKHRGLIRKRLLPVDIDGPLPPPGTDVKRGDVTVGEMRTAIAGHGLALLRLEDARGDRELRAALLRQLPREQRRIARHAVACGLIADAAGVTAAILVCYLFFG